MGAAIASSAACTPGRLDAIDLGPAAATTDLMAHYTFDDGAGTIVADHSGNARNGTLTGGTWIVDGKFGGALHLDGMSYVTVENFPNAPPSFTVSSWVRTSSWYDAGLETVVSTEYVFDGGWQVNVTNDSEGGVGLQGAFWDDVLGAYTYYGCTCLPLNTWTHFAFVVDEASHTLTTYVSGQPPNVTAAPNPITPGTPWLAIGNWSESGRLLIGDVDDVAIYSRALAPAEILALEQRSPPDVL
jgi:hypothetical protein